MPSKELVHTLNQGHQSDAVVQFSERWQHPTCWVRLPCARCLCWVVMSHLYSIISVMESVCGFCNSHGQQRLYPFYTIGFGAVAALSLWKSWLQAERATTVGVLRFCEATHHTTQVRIVMQNIKLFCSGLTQCSSAVVCWYSTASPCKPLFACTGQS